MATTLTEQVLAAYAATECTERDVLSAMQFLRERLGEYYRQEFAHAARVGQMEARHVIDAERALAAAEATVAEGLRRWPGEAAAARDWGTPD